MTNLLKFNQQIPHLCKSQSSLVIDMYDFLITFSTYEFRKEVTNM